MNPVRLDSSLATPTPSAGLPRRRFLRHTLAGAAAAGLAPQALWGAASAPKPRVTLAGIGVGGVGFGQLQECEKAGFEIVALCDVDDSYAQKAFDRWPKARRCRDYRELLAHANDIEAVYIGTPDHTHAVIVMEALRQRKHVCCVKPLTHTLHESWTVVDAARKAGVATQVTAAPNTSEDACRTAEIISAGLLGAVREVHVWSNRPVWPQAILRPAGEDPIPRSLDWDLWIGPAPMRPFKQEWPQDAPARTQMKSMESWFAGYLGVYHPFNFRGWWDFGTGALGDMGCHHFNPLFRALQLEHPSAVQATASKVYPESAPLASIVTYDFPSRPSLPPVRVIWYDGGLKPPTPSEFGAEGLPAEGTLYLGEEGKLLTSWEGLRLRPESKTAALASVPRSLPRRGGTWVEWFEACRGGEPAGCNFDWSERLTEAVLLGNIALRVGKPLLWDARARTFTHAPEANALLQTPYRQGWTL